MRRRTLLVTGATGITAIVASSLLPPGQPWLKPWLTAPFVHNGRLPAGVYAHIAGLSQVSFVGRTLLQQQDTTTGGGDIEALEDWLIRRLGVDDPGQIDASAFLAAVQSAIAEDFANGRMIAADGWLVSETEAHVAAWRYRLHGAREPSGPAPLRSGVIAEVTAWGPQSTEQGVPVNVQSDGHSGLWFQASGVPSWVKLEIDGTIAATQVFENLVTSGLYGEIQKRILATPGRYPLAFVDEMSRVRQVIGHFEVVPTPERLIHPDGTRSRAFCAVIDWGPGELSLSRPDNIQANGDIGLWFKTECAAPQTRVLIDDQVLVSTVDLGQGVVTALLPPSRLTAGSTVTVSFHDPESGERHRIGTLVIRE